MSEDKSKDTKRLVEETKETSRTSLLYWTNSTTTMFGLNHTITTLIEMISTIVEYQIPIEQLDKARDAIVGVLDEAVADAKAAEEAKTQAEFKLKVVKKKKSEEMN